VMPALNSLTLPHANAVLNGGIHRPVFPPQVPDSRNAPSRVTLFKGECHGDPGLRQFESPEVRYMFPGNESGVSLRMIALIQATTCKRQAL